MGPPAAAAAALAAATALPTLRNGFVYDDVLVILQNPLVHGLTRSAAIWHSSYWPVGQLYRPLTLQLFALEWRLGGGNPAVFHAVSILLAALVALLVFRLVLRVLPSDPQNPSHRWNLWAAFLAAAAFALHPVHVEVVANVVGQSELLAAACALLAVERYLAWRAEERLTAARRLLLAALTLLGILAKETGYSIPFLLAAAELTLLRRPRKGVAASFVLQGCVLVAALLLRVSVLGSLAGESPAAVFHGMGGLGRAVAMLAVVPQWARLLLWPAHLQAEYGPPALPLTASLGPAHGLGLGILVLVGVLLLLSWRRSPVVAFGLLWILLALAPVCNLVAPTGIVVAERVLFLPSVGVVLLVGAGAVALRTSLALAPAPRRVAAASAVALLLALAGARTLTRQTVWRSQSEFFAVLPGDAPGSYRAQFVAARYDYGERRFPAAEQAARRALALYALDPQVHEQLGQILRVEGRCAEALPVLAEGVRLDPARTTVRSRLIECALAVGDSSRARASAREAVRLGQTEFQATLQRLSP